MKKEKEKEKEKIILEKKLHGLEIYPKKKRKKKKKKNTVLYRRNT